ncbi:MAG: DUF1549 domain-containing protein, partial [Verrucomicrobiota bacterium]
MKHSLLLLFGAAHGVSANPTLPTPVARPVDFASEIQPIFEAKCIQCHGAEKQKGGYRLDDKTAALHGGDGYAPNIVPGKSAESPLIHFVAGLNAEMKMPGKGDPLTAGQIALLRAWIDQGALWPEARAATVSKKEPLDWWSLKPLPKAEKAPGQAGNPIDRFIHAKRIEKGLLPSPPADPRTLVRRIYFDLVGLPPTPEESDAFALEALRNPQDAVRDLVDRLLESPRYGERW